MNDLDKFEKLFNDLGIEYTISNNKLSVNDNYIIEESYSYGKALDIAFSKDGKFLGFEPWGEQYLKFQFYKESE